MLLLNCFSSCYDLKNVLKLILLHLQYEIAMMPTAQTPMKITWLYHRDNV